MHARRPRLYFAAPLFSEAELAFNRGLRKVLTDYFDVYLPQEDGGLMVEMLKQGMSLNHARSSVFSGDVAAIERADYLMIVLDGRVVDEGAAFELGMAHAIGKRCVGFQSDPRRLLPSGNNPMLECALERVFHSQNDLVKWAVQESRGASAAQRGHAVRRLV